MPDVIREAEISASPEAITTVIADLPNWPAWFALHKGWIEEPPAVAAVGVTFRHRVRVLGVPAEMTWEVTEAEPPYRFAMRGKGSQRTNAAVTFVVEPSGTGSRVHIEADIGGLVLRPVKGQLRSWLAPRVQRTLDALAAQAQR